MIKNVVFDLGCVLIDYQPMDYLKSLGFNSATADALSKVIFESRYWPELDRGTYTMKQAIELFCADAPELEEQIRLALSDSWVELLKEIHGTSDFLKSVKAKGYKIYVLSNFHMEAFDYVEQKFDFFKFIDGKVISSHLGIIKPERGIYQALLDKYSLVPEETVFIDDVAKNIAAAEEFGIRGILFTSPDTAEAEFYRLCENA